MDKTNNNYKIAQDYKYEGEDWWNWQVWIEGNKNDLDEIAHVVYTLHPTFVNPVRKIDNRESKFRLEEEGWGGFTLYAKVVMKNEKSISLEHELTMNYPDGKKNVQFEQSAIKGFTNTEFQSYSKQSQKSTGISNQFNDIIQMHLNVYGAWLPITNNFQLGDYGIISDGIFTKMGNIREFDISFSSGQGPEASIDFVSADTRILKFAGGAEVNKIPDSAIDAKITFQFRKEISFLVKAPVIFVNVIENVSQVANALTVVRGWQKKWKVVYQTYIARDPVIVSTVSGDSEVSFTGDAKALGKLNLGEASIDMSSSKELGLYIQGKEGVIGIGLFKLKLFGGAPTFLSESEKKAPVEVTFLSPGEGDL